MRLYFDDDDDDDDDEANILICQISLNIKIKTSIKFYNKQFDNKQVVTCLS